MTDNYCDRCGAQLYGGSHWHCGQCDSPEETSMLGHSTKVAGFHNGEMVLLPEHMMSCKPGFKEACDKAMREAGAIV